MKTGLLRGIMAVFAILAIGTSLSAATIITNATFKVGEEILTANSDVVLGSTVDFKLDLSIPDDGAVYKIAFWELGIATNVAGWINGVSATSKVLISGTTYEGSYTLKGTTALAGTFRVAVFKDDVQQGASEWVSLAVTYVEGTAIAPTSSIVSIKTSTHDDESNWGGTYARGADVIFKVTYASTNATSVSINFFNKEDGAYAKWAGDSPFLNASLPASETETTADVSFTIPADAPLGISDVKAFLGTTWSSGITEVVGNLGVSESLPTSIEPVDATFSISPNTVSDVLTIKGAENASVAIINTAGVLVKSCAHAQAIQEVSVNDLSRGLYFVVVTKDASSSVQKFIIK